MCDIRLSYRRIGEGMNVIEHALSEFWGQQDGAFYIAKLSRSNLEQSEILWIILSNSKCDSINTYKKIKHNDLGKIYTNSPKDFIWKMTVWLFKFRKKSSPALAVYLPRVWPVKAGHGRNLRPIPAIFFQIKLLRNENLSRYYKYSF